jgi:hypothetical protein
MEFSKYIILLSTFQAAHLYVQQFTLLWQHIYVYTSLY